MIAPKAEKILKGSTNNWQGVLLGRNGQMDQIMWINKDDPTKAIFRDVLPRNEVAKLMERNHRARVDGINRKAQGRLAATIPAPHWYQWRRDWMDNARHTMSWDEYRKRKLNSYEFSKFRVGVNKL